MDTIVLVLCQVGSEKYEKGVEAAHLSYLGQLFAPATAIGVTDGKEVESDSVGAGQLSRKQGSEQMRQHDEL